MADYQRERIGALIQDMPVHWCLERVSTALYCVYNADSGVTLAGHSDPAQALHLAATAPLSESAQYYYRRAMKRTMALAKLRRWRESG